MPDARPHADLDATSRPSTAGTPARRRCGRCSGPPTGPRPGTPRSATASTRTAGCTGRRRRGCTRCTARSWPPTSATAVTSPSGSRRTDEPTTPDGRGRYNHFRRRARRSTGRRRPARTRSTARSSGLWSATGWERGPHGYPRSSELATPTAAAATTTSRTAASTGCPDVGRAQRARRDLRGLGPDGLGGRPARLPGDRRDGHPGRRSAGTTTSRAARSTGRRATGAHAVYGAILGPLARPWAGSGPTSATRPATSTRSRAAGGRTSSAASSPGTRGTGAVVDRRY